MSYGLIIFIIFWIISGILHYGLMNAFFLKEFDLEKSDRYYKKTIFYISILGYIALISAIIFLASSKNLFKNGIVIKNS